MRPVAGDRLVGVDRIAPEDGEAAEDAAPSAGDADAGEPDSPISE